MHKQTDPSIVTYSPPPGGLAQLRKRISVRRRVIRGTAGTALLAGIILSLVILQSGPGPREEKDRYATLKEDRTAVLRVEDGAAARTAVSREGVHIYWVMTMDRDASS